MFVNEYRLTFSYKEVHHVVGSEEYNDICLEEEELLEHVGNAILGHATKIASIDANSEESTRKVRPRRVYLQNKSGLWTITEDFDEIDTEKNYYVLTDFKAYSMYARNKKEYCGEN